MYAVICSPQYWKEIESTITSKNGQILLKAIDTDIDINAELNKMIRVPVRHLIIDITAISDENRFINALINYRIRNDRVQIIIIAPNSLPGNELIHRLVTQVHVYDIIAPSIDSDSLDGVNLGSLIDECIDNPSTYKRGIKWVIEGDVSTSINETSNQREKVKVVEKETERTVTIIKDKIVGTVVIALVGTINRIGTTHTAISIANILKNDNFRVAVLELHNSNNLNTIKNAYEDVQEHKDYFSLNGVDYFPFSNDLNFLDVYQEDYNYMILDMGVYSSCNLDEYKRANVKIVVSGVKDWELTDLEIILRSGDSIYKNNYLFTFSDTETFEMIKGNMDQLKCFLSPFNPNPFKNLKDFTTVTHELLKDVLPEIKQSKSKNSKGLISKLLTKGGD